MKLLITILLAVIMLSSSAFGQMTDKVDSSRISAWGFLNSLNGMMQFTSTTYFDSTGGGELIVVFSDSTNAITAGAVLLNDIGDPDGNTVISLGSNGITFNIANPSSNAFELNATGAFSGHLFHVHQTSGNPGPTHLVHIESTDPDVVPLCALTRQDTVMIFGGSGGPTFTSWIDSLGFYHGDLDADSADVSETLVSPLIVGGTSTTADLSLKTTSGVGASGADMHFLVGNDGAKEAMTILNNGNVGIGTNSPNGSLEIKGPNPGSVGGWPAGALQITAEDASQFTPAVITGHNSYSGNTQLWYLGSHSSSNDDIGFINRQDAAIHFWTNNTARMSIDNTGYVGIGTDSPPERLSVVGSIATGDTIAGDLDVYHYFSTDGSWVTEYLKWDDGLLRFEISDDFDVTGDITVSGTVDGVDVAARDAVLGQIINDTLYYIFTVPDPDAYYALDAEWIIDKFTTDAITIVSIDVTLDADPTTEFEFSLKFADAFIGFANATVIDDTATVAGVTTVTGGFGDATVPADKVIYFVIDADPDDAITQAGFKIGFTVD